MSEPLPLSRRRRPAAFALLFGDTVLLAALRASFGHYSIFDRFPHYLGLLHGSRPHLPGTLLLSIECFGWILLLQLFLALLLPGRGVRHWAFRLLAGLIFLLATAALDYSLFLYFTVGLSPGWLALAGVGALLALFLFVFVAGKERDKAPSGRGGRLWLFLAAGSAAAALVVVLRFFSFFLEFFPGLGFLVRPAFDLTLVLLLFYFLSRALGRQGGPLASPSLLFPLLSTFVAILFLSLAIISPSPPRSLAARPLPTMVNRTELYPFEWEERGPMFLAATERLAILAGQDPLSLTVFDQSKEVLLRLCSEEECGARAGIVLHNELYSLAELPPWRRDRLIVSRLRLWSHPLTAAEKSEKVGQEIIMRGRSGGVPFALSLSFLSPEILRLTLETPSSLLSLHRLSVSLAPGEEELFLGLGGIPGPLDRRGKEADLWLSPAEREKSGRVPEQHFAWGSRLRFSELAAEKRWLSPFLFLSRRVGVFIAESTGAAIEVKKTPRPHARFSVQVNRLTLYVIAGGAPVEVLENYAWLTGPRRTPPLSVLLPWVRAEACGESWKEELAAELNALRQKGIPAEWVQVKRCGEGGRLVEEGAEVKELLEHGRALGFRFALEDTITFAGEREEFEEAHRAGLLVKDQLGFPLCRGNRVLLDLSRPEARLWKQKEWRYLMRLGFEGIFLDPHALLPAEAVLYNGARGMEARNLYPLLYGEAAAEVWPAEAVIGAAPGWAGLERYVSLVWPEEAEESTSSAAERRLEHLLNLSMSGVPVLGPGLNGKSGEEGESMLAGLAAQVAAPLFLLPQMGPAETTSSPPPLSEDTVRRLAEQHVRLFPFLATLMAAQSQSGRPVFTPSFLADASDTAWHERADEYLAGRGLLVAIAKKGRKGEVSLPSGRWLRLDTQEFYEAGRHLLQARGEGPLLFLREGTLLPVEEESFHTLSPIDNPEIKLRGQELTIIWPGGNKALLTLYDGARLSTRRERETLFFVVEGGEERFYRLRVHECGPVRAVFAQGIRLPDGFWTYQERARLLSLLPLPGPPLTVEIVLAEGESGGGILREKSRGWLQKKD